MSAQVPAIIPAYREDPEDVLAVAQVAEEAGCAPFVVWQQHEDDGDSAARCADGLETGDGAPMIVVDGPLGKGGAVKAAVGRNGWGMNPIVVLDADLQGLDPRVVRDFAIAAVTGCWARPTYKQPGRVGTRVLGALDAALGWSVPLVLRFGGLNAPIHAYPAGSLVFSSGENGYGWDLDLALALLASDVGDQMPLAAVNGGVRQHRPSSDPQHLRGMLADNLAVIARWSSWSG